MEGRGHEIIKKLRCAAADFLAVVSVSIKVVVGGPLAAVVDIHSELGTAVHRIITNSRCSGDRLEQQ